MQQSKRQRDHQQQHSDAKRHLQRDGGEQKESAGARGSCFHRARGVERMQQRNDKDHVGEHPMVELHRQRILEKISPERRCKQQVRGVWNERAVDQRPGIVDVAGAQSGNQRAEIDLHQHEHHKTDGAGSDARPCPPRPAYKPGEDASTSRRAVQISAT